MVCGETVLEANGIRTGLGHGLILMGLVSVTQHQLLALCHLDGLLCHPGVCPWGAVRKATRLPAQVQVPLAHWLWAPTQLSKPLSSLEKR